MAVRNGVFISYARKDGESFAASLRERFVADAPDICVAQDRILLEGGDGWWKQLTEAIDRSEFLILVMTPASVSSDSVAKEWRYARQRGVCVYPVLGAPAQALFRRPLPKWMSDSHFYDIDKEWNTLIGHIRAGCRAKYVPFMAPDLPSTYVQRPAEYQALKELILSAEGETAVSITSVTGAGGFGKTTLAAALCHDADVIEHFDGGILWIALGQEPDLMATAVTVFAALTDTRPAFASFNDAADKIAGAIGDLHCLFVIDDVWDISHLLPFTKRAKNSVRLLTTRKPYIVLEGKRVNVDEMKPEEASDLLRKGFADTDANQLISISGKLGRCPLALELARAAAARRVAAHDTTIGAFRHLELALDRKGLDAIPIDSAIATSLALLSQANQNRLAELCIFSEDAAVPVIVAADLWGFDAFDSEEAAVEIASTSLVKLDLGAGSLRLHDVIRTWLVRRCLKTEPEVHSRLVDRWPDWYDLREDYAWRYLSWHLVRAGRRGELRKLLLDPRWLMAKLDRTDVHALITDYERCLCLGNETDPDTADSGDPVLLVLRGLRQCAHVIAEDPNQVCGQLKVQLGGNAIPEVTQFLTGLAVTQTRPYLDPVTYRSEDPAGATIATLRGHTAAVCACAFGTGKDELITASEDGTLRTWNLRTLKCTRSVWWKTGMVADIAPEGGIVLSCRKDFDPVRVAGIETGEQQESISTGELVESIAVTRDGRYAAFGYPQLGRRDTLIFWDVTKNARVRELPAVHAEFAGHLTFHPDGSLVCSRSFRPGIVLDSTSGEDLCDFDDEIKGPVALSPDGQCAVSSGFEGLRVWDRRADGYQTRLFAEAQGGGTTSICTDGQRVVQGFGDGSIRVCLISRLSDTGRPREREWPAKSDSNPRYFFPPEGQWVRLSVGFTPSTSDETLYGLSGYGWMERVAEGIDRVAALDSDGSVRLWTYADGRWTVRFISHGPEATSWSEYARERSKYMHATFLAARPNANLVAAGYLQRDYGGIRVWRIGDDERDWLLEGHTNEVTALDFAADGSFVVSGSSDQSVRIWDLTTSETSYQFTLTSMPIFVRRLSSGKLLIVTEDAQFMLLNPSINGLEWIVKDLWRRESSMVKIPIFMNMQRYVRLACSPGEESAVTSTNDGCLQVWDITTGVRIAAFDCDGMSRETLGFSSKNLISTDFGVFELLNDPRAPTSVAGSSPVPAALGRERT
jgi:WD40 repeat protein